MSATLVELLHVCAEADPEVNRRLVDLEAAVGTVSVTAHPQGIELHGWLDGMAVTEVVLIDGLW